jgi:hypothetical protein
VTYFFGVVLGVAFEVSLLVVSLLAVEVSLAGFGLSPFLGSDGFSDFDSDFRA